MTKRIVLMLVPFALLCSCSDKATEPGGGGAFQLNIRLTDASGNPMPGIKICGWNPVPCWVTLDDCKAGSLPASDSLPSSPRLYGCWPNPFEPAAYLQFDAAEACSAFMQFRDLDQRHIRTLVRGVVPAGHHAIMWDCRDSLGQVLPATLYEARLELWSSDRHTFLFGDSTWIADYSVDLDDPAIRLGFTDAGGQVVCEEKRRFPSLYTYPPLIARDEQGMVLGTFTYSDTLVIAAADTAAHATRMFRRVLTSGVNNLSLLWE